MTNIDPPVVPAWDGNLRVREHTEAMNRLGVPWLAAPNILITSRLNERTQLMALYFLSLRRDQHPSYARIAADLRIGKRHVIAHLNELLQRHILARDFYKDAKGKKRSCFHITDPSFWQLDGEFNPYSAPTGEVDIDPTTHEPNLYRKPKRHNEADDAIKEHGHWTQIPRALVQTPELGYSDKRVWCYLAMCPDYQHPQVADVAYALDLHKQTVIKSLISLEELRLIFIERRTERSRGEAAHRYHIPSPYFWRLSNLGKVRRPETSSFFEHYEKGVAMDFSTLRSFKKYDENNVLHTQVQSGTVADSGQVQSGTVQVQSGTVQVQSGTVQVQSGTVQVQSGTVDPIEPLDASPVQEGGGETIYRDSLNETGWLVETPRACARVDPNQPTNHLKNEKPNCEVWNEYGKPKAWVCQAAEGIERCFHPWRRTGRINYGLLNELMANLAEEKGATAIHSFTEWLNQFFEQERDGRKMSLTRENFHYLFNLSLSRSDHGFAQ